jgi:hypothetical protein
MKGLNHKKDVISLIQAFLTAPRKNFDRSRKRFQWIESYIALSIIDDISSEGEGGGKRSRNFQETEW